MSPKQTLACIVARMRDAARNRVREGEDDRLVLKWANELAALPVGDAEPFAWVRRNVTHNEYATGAQRPPRDGWEPLYTAPPPAAPCPYVRSGDEGTHYCTLSGPSAVPSWQQIETAPKDGTMILLGWHNTEAWTRVDAAYASHGIWWGSSDGKGCYNATHWMPLPAAPTPEDKSR